MTSQRDQPIELLTRKRVARKYRTLGYDVLENPDPRLLPEFMHGAAPDIIARSSLDNVVIEIKRHASLVGSNDIVGIAERVSGHSDWRFELVVLDDTDSGPSEVDHEKLLDAVRSAINFKMFDMAFVYIVNALVGTARILAKKNGIASNNKADRSLFLDLGFKGILPNTLLESCLSALSTRNRLAHGLDDFSGPPEQEVRHLLQLHEKLGQLL